MWAFTSDWSGGELLIPQILRGFPQAFAVAPAINLGLGSLPPERLKYVSGPFNMMRDLGDAVGIGVRRHSQQPDQIQFFSTSPRI
jgi:MFS transporter, DHA2 family, multidrug resistance protein